jgi:hypothetical protein
LEEEDEAVDVAEKNSWSIVKNTLAGATGATSKTQHRPIHPILIRFFGILQLQRLAVLISLSSFSYGKSRH